MKRKVLTLLLGLAPFSSFILTACGDPSLNEYQTSQAGKPELQGQLQELINQGLIEVTDEGEATVSDDGQEFINELREKGLIHQVQGGPTKTICM